MIGPTVTDGDSQTQQPNRQQRMLVLTITAPGRAVVHQHPLRQTITAKSGGQSVFYPCGRVVAGRLAEQRKARGNVGTRPWAAGPAGGPIQSVLWSPTPQ